MEFTSDKDFFFLFVHRLQEATYPLFAARQKLRASFQDYPTMLIKLFNSCIKNPQAFVASLNLETNKPSVLEIKQNVEYKTVTHLACEFEGAHEDKIRVYTSY